MEEKKQTTVQNSAPEQTPPVPPSEPVSKPNLKFKPPILILGVVLFTILIGIASAYFVLNAEQKPKQEVKTIVKVSPTPDPTANWKTYTNVDLGFSIKYPPDLNVGFQGIPQADVNASPPPDPNKPYFAKRDKNIGTETGWTIFPGINNNSEKLSLQDWVTNKIIMPAKTQYEKTGDPTSIVQNNKTVNGKQIITVSGAYNPRANEILVAYFALGDKIFSLTLDPYSADKDIINVLLKMVASAKLIENQTIDTSNWKTYTNSLYGFSFKYPSDWSSKLYDPYSDSVLSLLLVPTRFQNATLSDPGGEFPPQVAVNIIRDSDNLSVSEYLKKIEPAFAPNFKSQTINGITGMRGSDGGATQNDNFIVAHGDYIYKIRFNHAANSEIDIPIETFNKVLSTFKFTK